MGSARELHWEMGDALDPGAKEPSPGLEPGISGSGGHPLNHSVTGSLSKGSPPLGHGPAGQPVRRARAYNSRPSARQLTAIETEHLNSILARPQLGQVAATASATSSGATATELNAAPERTEPAAPFARKRSRQKSSALNRFTTAELVPDVTSSHQMVQRMKRSGHAQFCF